MSRPPLREKATIAFDYIKSQNFQTLHVDGAIGGPTPRGDVNIAFFAERAALPRRIVHQVDDIGSLGEVVEVESRDSIVREMGVTVVMSTTVARELYNWLGEQLSRLEGNGERK